MKPTRTQFEAVLHAAEGLLGGLELVDEHGGRKAFAPAAKAAIRVAALALEEGLMVRRAERWQDLFALDRVPARLQAPGYELDD